VLLNESTHALVFIVFQLLFWPFQYALPLQPSIVPVPVSRSLHVVGPTVFQSLIDFRSRAKLPLSSQTQLPPLVRPTFSNLLTKLTEQVFLHQLISLFQPLKTPVKRVIPLLLFI
jgi:hypothetical protein